jgi:hypothetical protein
MLLIEPKSNEKGTGAHGEFTFGAGSGGATPISFYF